MDQPKRRVSSDNYFAITPEWVLYADISPTAKVVYAVLQRYANSDSFCFPSRKTIAERILVSVKSVDRALEELEKVGAIRINRRQNPDGSYTSNLYQVVTLNPRNPVTVLGTKTTLGGDKNDPRGRDKNDTLTIASINQSQESEISCAFAEFWVCYPRKKGKQQALRAWEKAIKTGVEPAAIIEGAKRYALERDGEDPQYTAHPATWLNAGRWDDEPDPNHIPKTTTRQDQTDRVQQALQRIREQQREITA